MVMWVFLEYGVPQGLVLGLVLYLVYNTSDLVKLVRSLNLIDDGANKMYLIGDLIEDLIDN